MKKSIGKRKIACPKIRRRLLCVFRYIQHRAKRPGYSKVLGIATSHRGTLSYSQSAEILRKEDLGLGRREYYNLQRKKEEGNLSDKRSSSCSLKPLKMRVFTLEFGLNMN
jgi:hypothetical protein